MVMIEKLLSLEILCSSENLNSVQKYLEALGFWVAATRGNVGVGYLYEHNSVYFILREAVSGEDISKVQTCGTTICDIGFQVDNLKKISEKVHELPISIGTCAVIHSVIPGLTHTLFQSGEEEKGWIEVFQALRKELFEEDWIVQSAVSHQTRLYSFVDHITFACEVGKSNSTSEWYQKTFNMTNRSGATVLKSVGGGIRLSALWHKRDNEVPYNECVKLTFVEPVFTLQDQAKSNQVTSFLKYHNGPGVQHVAFFADDIFDATDLLRKNGIKFISAPPQYYDNETKRRQILQAGLSVEKVQDKELLFDANPGRSYGNYKRQPGYLLQVFTKSSFDRDTIFFELIFRGKDDNGNQTKGFGAGNIRDLFHAVAASSKQDNQTQKKHNTCDKTCTSDPKFAEMQKRVAKFMLSKERDEFFKEQCFQAQVVVMGAGLCGLTVALLLARQGVDVVVIDKETDLPRGTRAITWVKSTMDLWKSLGIFSKLQDESLNWSSGVVRYGEAFKSYTTPSSESYVNIPQYAVHAVLIEALAQEKSCRLVFGNKIVGIGDSLDREGMMVHVEPTHQHRPYSLLAQFVLDCCGANSLWRTHIAEEISPESGRFVICDVDLGGQDLPKERIFWIDPPFLKDIESCLFLPQPGNRARMDFLISNSLMVTSEVASDLSSSTLKVLIPSFDPKKVQIDWFTDYRYCIGTLKKAKEGRLVFLGDSLKRVSPFGARGGNEGLRDVASIAWRISWILWKKASPDLLLEHERERLYASNCDVIINRATMRFINPRNEMKFLRDAVFEAAERDEACKQLINTGRFSFPPPKVQSSISEGLWDEMSLMPGEYFFDGVISLRDKNLNLGDVVEPFKFIALVFGAFEPPLELEGFQVLNFCLQKGGDETYYPSPEMVKAYDISENCVIVLRPDLVIFGRSKLGINAFLDLCFRSIISPSSTPEYASHEGGEWISTPRTRISRATPQEALELSDLLYYTLYDLLEGLSDRRKVLCRIISTLTKQSLSEVLRCFRDEKSAAVEVFARAISFKGAKEVFSKEALIQQISKACD